MRRLILTFSLAALTFVGLNVATSTAAEAWTCRASSPTGSWGMGWHTRSRSYARRRALYECARRTPRRFYCRIRWCRRGVPR